MVWEVLPFLPEVKQLSQSQFSSQELVDELSSESFENTCLNFFMELDKE